jgi:hypothetical protein
MSRLYRTLAVVLIGWMATQAPAAAQPLPAGAGTTTVKLDDVGIKLLTYRPQCRDPSLLLVFPGTARNAQRYRDRARELADRGCRLVVTPQLDSERFPRWRYQHGGIVRQGVVQDSREWTGRIILEMVERLRKMEGRRMPYSMIGHSAGGQFLSRVAAFVPTEAQRIVVANPGTHVFPDLSIAAPYGMGGVYPEAGATEELRRYLRQPVTIYLGQGDTGDDELNVGAEALAQGQTRHERGLNAFGAAQRLAQTRSWPLNWRLVEVPKIEHDPSGMLSAKQASEALRP